MVWCVLDRGAVGFLPPPLMKTTVDQEQEEERADHGDLTAPLADPA
jgi:hypothetical protein